MTRDRSACVTDVCRVGRSCDGALVEVEVARSTTEEVTVIMLDEGVVALAGEAEFWPAQFVVRRHSAMSTTKRRVAIEPVSSKSRTSRHDLVIVDEILLAGNHHAVMMNSYPTFIFVK